MALTFNPRPGQVVMCDFDEYGFAPPEMIKMRHVVVVSSDLKGRPQDLFTIVALSTSPPRPDTHQYNISLQVPYAPSRPETFDCWAKCDMVYALSRRHMDRLIAPWRDLLNKKVYLVPRLTADQLLAVRRGIAFTIGLGASL